jgi:hypothetical protein
MTVSTGTQIAPQPIAEAAWWCAYCNNNVCGYCQKGIPYYCTSINCGQFSESVPNLKITRHRFNLDKVLVETF